MVLKQESDVALVENPNRYDEGSKLLVISHLDDIFLHTETTKELLNLFRVASNFVQSPSKSAFFHARRLYTRTKVFLGEMTTNVVNYRTDSAPEFVSLFNTSMSYLARRAVTCCRYFSALCVYTAMTQGSGKEFGRLHLELIYAELSETCRSCPRTLIMLSRRRW